MAFVDGLVVLSELHFYYQESLDVHYLRIFVYLFLRFGLFHSLPFPLLHNDRPVVVMVLNGIVKICNF